MFGTHRSGSNVKIAVSTALFGLSGERMNHAALAQAMDWRENNLASRGSARASAELGDNAPTAAE